MRCKLTRLRATRGQDYLSAALDSIESLITLLGLNLTARKLKAHQSGQWLVIREMLARKEF